MSFHHAMRGTPEADWLTALEDRPPPAFELQPGTRLLVVVAAHPDDETLGAGGLIAHAHGRGIPVEVLVLSDGEASHPDSPTRTPEELAEIRRREVAHAVHALAPDVRPRQPGLPDGRLAEHVDSATSLLREIVGDIGVGAVLAAPWEGDRHPDHEAAAQAAERVARETGALLLEYPVWAWHWGRPQDLPWDRLVALPLTEADHAAKRTALARHRSQVEPLSDEPGDELLLTADMLGHFDRGREVFVDPAGDATRPVLERLHRRSADPWAVGASAYEHDKRAATLDALPAERTFEHVLDAGCSIGALTAELAARAHRVTALDLSETAVAAAQRRLAGLAHVDVRTARLPQDWPDGRFDLVVVSEIAYFLSPEELDGLADRARAALAPGGLVLVCSWRHEVDGWPWPDGQAAHAHLVAALGLEPTLERAERDYRLTVLEER